MKKYLYVAMPFVMVGLSWVYEVTGFRRYGPDDPGVDPGDVDWGSILVRAMIATAAYFALEVFRRRRRATRPSSSQA